MCSLVQQVLRRSSGVCIVLSQIYQLISQHCFDLVFMCSSLSIKNKHVFFSFVLYNPRSNAFVKSTRLLLAGGYACTLTLNLAV